MLGKSPCITYNVSAIWLFLNEILSQTEYYIGTYSIYLHLTEISAYVYMRYILHIYIIYKTCGQRSIRRVRRYYYLLFYE